jgi:hypothetical protein
VTRSATKQILTVANPFLTHSRSKVSYQWLLQKLFEKKNMLGWPLLTLNCWPALIKLAVPSDRRELQPYKKLPIAAILWHLKKKSDLIEL